MACPVGGTERELCVVATQIFAQQRSECGAAQHEATARRCMLEPLGAGPLGGVEPSQPGGLATFVRRQIDMNDARPVDLPEWFPPAVGD